MVSHIIIIPVTYIHVVRQLVMFPFYTIATQLNSYLELEKKFRFNFVVLQTSKIDCRKSESEMIQIGSQIAGNSRYVTLLIFHVTTTAEIRFSLHFALTRDQMSTSCTFSHKTAIASKFVAFPHSGFLHPAHVGARIVFHLVEAAVKCDSVHLLIRQLFLKEGGHLPN